MKFGRKWVAWMLCAALMLGCAGCQEDPDGSLVKHKDMDKFISEAAGSQAGRQDVADLQADVAENFERYQAELKNESLGVQIHVDAQVEVPEVDKLNIYRVRQKTIDQDLVDKVVAEFMPGETLYDGAALSTRTRAEVERDIQYFRQDIENEKDFMRESGEYTEDEIEEEIQRLYQLEIENLQREYENAPETFELEDFPGSSRLQSPEEMAAKLEGYFAQWQNTLNPSGGYLYAITDGSDGLYKSLYVQNSSNYSNKLTYNCNPTAWVRNGGCLVGGTYLGGHEDPYKMAEVGGNQFWDAQNVPGIVINDFVLTEGTECAPVPGWTCDLTGEEAEAKAEALLGKLGFDGFALGRCELCSETLSLENPGNRSDEKVIPYATYYILKYYRDIDGVLLTQSSGVKYDDGWTDEGVFKKEMWPGECIELRVNDSGVVGFSVLAPVEITETVVDSAALKPFEEVKDTFESMAAVTRAREYEQVVGKVDKVRLSYSRISEKDSFDTGLIVPVWSFEGEETYYTDEALDGSWDVTMMAINAIDGSIIDATLGY